MIALSLSTMHFALVYLKKIIFEVNNIDDTPKAQLLYGGGSTTTTCLLMRKELNIL